MPRRKRPQRTGSVRKLPSGKFQARVSDPLTGRQVGIGTFASRDEAEDAIARARTEQAQGLWTGTSKSTVGDWLTHWVAMPGRRPKTDRNYRWACDRLVPMLGRHELRKLTTLQIQAALNTATVEGLSPASVTTLRAVLSAAMTDAVRAGMVARNPVHGVKVAQDLRGTEERMHIITAAQLLDLADTVGRLVRSKDTPGRWVRPEQLTAGQARQADIYRALVLFAGLVGCRWGEMVALDWRKVNLLHRTVRIDVQDTEVGGKLVTGPPKSRAAIRTLHLPATVVRALETAQAHTGGRGRVFPATQGGALRRSNFEQRVLSPAMAAVGIPDEFRIHDLRHTAASLALQQGASLKAVQVMLGHSSFVLTAQVYAHLFPDDRAVADAADRAMLTLVEAEPPPPVAQLRESSDPGV